MQVIRLKAGYGYWDTTYYPIGGCFHRALVSGLILTDIEPMDRPTKGCTHTAKIDAGNRTIVFDMANAVTNEE
jgi:hypothetical protein